jgi:hypothetical protein
MPRIARALIATMCVSGGLLAGAVPAQATLATVPFCGSLHPGGGWDPVTLTPGQACTFVPVNVHAMHIEWSITHDGGPGGAILLGVVQSPPGYPNGQVLGPTGAPGQWGGGNPEGGGAWWFANNGFSAVGGQPTVVNYSTDTIKLWPNSGFLQYYY